MFDLLFGVVLAVCIYCAVGIAFLVLPTYSPLMMRFALWIENSWVRGNSMTVLKAAVWVDSCLLWPFAILIRALHLGIKNMFYFIATKCTRH